MKTRILAIIAALILGTFIGYPRHRTDGTESAKEMHRKTNSTAVFKKVRTTEIRSSLTDSGRTTSTPPASANPEIPDRTDPVIHYFGKLAAMKPSDAAIDLSHDLEEYITPQNTAAFVEALLTTDNPAVERVTHAALARTADSGTLMALVNRYGTTPEERRGRILQILENAQNPAAAEALMQIVANDTNEKRSPLLVSAMNGLANLSNAESVGYLLGQVATYNETFALMALERVRTDQAREMIRAASAGNKDSVGIAPEHLDALAQIALENERKMSVP